MKITVDIPDSEMEEVCLFTGETKKGPAILKMVTDALRLKRREKLAGKFITGEWGVAFDGVEVAQAANRKSIDRRAQAWRS